MNDITLAILLGVIEGITEFLPVSSTAHLRIAQAMLGLDLSDEYWKMFAIVIQLGAILSVIVYFHQRLLGLLKSFPWKAPVSRKALAHPLSLAMIAFVVTAIPAFLMSKIIGKNLESLVVIGCSLLFGGIAMWVIDRFVSRPRVNSLEEMTLSQAVWVGAVQILSAVFPGTSRSMSTIAGGQLAGLSRGTALEFSFFVSIPTMMAATSYDLLKTVVFPKADMVPVVMNSDRWLTLSVGFIVSFLVAWAVIAWFMGWVRRRGFTPFAIYRVIFGALVLAAAFTGQLG